MIDPNGTDTVEQMRKSLDQALEALRADREPWIHTYSEIARYIKPGRYKWFITPNENRGGKLNYVNRDIVDTTVLKCFRDLAAGLMGAMISPARLWFNLTLVDKDLADRSDVKLYLAECRRRMLAVMAASNFYPACHTMLSDLPAFGTAPMLILEDYENVIHCYNPCAGEYFVGVNAKFEVDTLFREFNLTARQIVEQFGIDNVSDQVKTAYNTKSSTQQFVICHAIQPDPLDKHLPIQEVYWEKASTQTFMLLKKGYHEFPGLCVRWDVAGNEAYGSTFPGLEVLGDVKQLMLSQRRKAQAIDKMVNPPLKAPISMKNQPASGLPGGITYYDPNTAGDKGFSPVYTVMPNLVDMKEDIAEVQNRLRELTYNDLFLMLDQLPGVQPRNNMEIMERKQEKLLLLGPTVERLQREGLKPMIDRVFAVMSRANLFPKAPQDIQGQHIDVEYSSMFSEAQKAVGTTGIEQWIGFVGNLAAAFPNVRDNVNADKLVDTYRDMLDVAPDLMNDPSVIDAKRQAENQAAAQQRAVATAQAAVQGAQTLSQTPVGAGQSALDLMVGGAQ